MKAYRVSAGVLLSILVSLVLLPGPASPGESGLTAPKRPASVERMTPRDRGRYLVMIGGCNDCHTPRFAQTGGAAPETEWLAGDSVGWRGPWGRTYARNLRLFVQNISEEGWVSWARVARGLPPMPGWALNTMTDADLRSIYRFIKSLGPKGTRSSPLSDTLPSEDPVR